MTTRQWRVWRGFCGIVAVMLVLMLPQRALAQTACNPATLPAANGIGAAVLFLSATPDGACRSGPSGGMSQVQVITNITVRPGTGGGMIDASATPFGQIIAPGGSFAVSGPCTQAGLTLGCVLTGRNAATGAELNVAYDIALTVTRIVNGVVQFEAQPTRFAVAGTAFDTAMPAPVLTSLEGPGPHEGAINVEIDFGQPVTGFTASDIRVTGAADVSLAPGDPGQGARRIIRVVPLDGTRDSPRFVNGRPQPSTVITDVTLQVLAGAVEGPLGQRNPASNPLLLRFNAFVPRIVMSSPARVVRGDTIIAGFRVEPRGGFREFEQLQGFVRVENAEFTGGSINGFGGRQDFSFIRTGFGPVRVTFLRGAATASLETLLSPEVSFDILPALTPAAPGAILSHPDVFPRISGPVTFDLTFSEPVTGLDATDLTVTGGTVTQITGADGSSDYRVTARPTIARGSMRVQLNAGAVTSLATGTANADQPRISALVLIDPVTVTTQAEIFGIRPYDLRIDFERQVTGFSDGDLRVANATVGSLRELRDRSVPPGGQSFRVFVTPLARVHEVSVPAGVAVDEFGNPNLASAGAVIPPGVGPVLRIDGLAGDLIEPGPRSVFFTFSEDVMGFEQADITVTGGTIRSFAGTGSSYAAVIDFAATRDLTVTVPAGAAMGASGPSQGASGTGQFDSATVAQRLISGYLAARSNALLTAQPDISGFLRGRGGVFDLTATRGNGHLSFHSGQNRPVWAAFEATWSDSDTAKDRYLLGSFGAHGQLNDHLLMGVMAQFDQIERRDGVARMKGQGWLLGPYVAAAHPTQPLFFDARLLWGQTRNEITPVGTYTDRFSTTRWLTQVNVTGSVPHGEITWLPHLRLAYTEDKAQTYTDGLGNVVGGQTARQGQIDIGLGFERAIFSQFTVLTGEISGLWTTDDNSLTTQRHPFEGGRGRVELGLRHNGPSGLSYAISAHHDGIGENDYTASGVELRLDLTF